MRFDIMAVINQDEESATFPMGCDEDDDNDENQWFDARETESDDDSDDSNWWPAEESKFEEAIGNCNRFSNAYGLNRVLLKNCFLDLDLYLC